ncbi:hypothetical protein WHR41_07789 [Cladosporium halotolerans]|uniref:Zn(2)-C6 fungal-type domain-containing protein n=1 Tax=Cladosporium halotolerans TaxID=1052096 RepID=A0AB34KIP1_9PEZI
MRLPMSRAEDFITYRHSIEEFMGSSAVTNRKSCHHMQTAPEPQASRYCDRSRSQGNGVSKISRPHRCSSNKCTRHFHCVIKHATPTPTHRKVSPHDSDIRPSTPPADIDQRPQNDHSCKRTLIQAACFNCRARKAKCNGSRPSCSNCQKRDVDCQYSTEEGETRWSALRRRTNVLQQERDKFLELLQLLRCCPEGNAPDILRCLRDSPRDINESLRTMKAVLALGPFSKHGLSTQPCIDTPKLSEEVHPTIVDFNAVLSLQD